MAGDPPCPAPRSSRSLRAPKGSATSKPSATASPAERHPLRETERVYYDSFDWRVHRSGHVLSRVEVDGALWLVLEPADGTRVHRVRLVTEPGFASGLPPGPLRDRLLPILEMRRLLPRLVAREERDTLDVLDGEDKTVCRVVLEGGASWRPDAGGSSNGAVHRAEVLPARLVLVPLRGYGESAKAVERACREELGLARAEASGFDLALAACGLEAPVDPSKPRIELEPEEPAEAATRRVLAAYLAVVEANEYGVRQELDTEFLHDFRVAIRRTRSLVSRLRDVFPPGRVEAFAGELRWLGGLTGPPRDLDVFALDLAELDELAELRGFVLQRRKEEQRVLVRGLVGERYRALLASWRSLVRESAPQPSLAGAAPARGVAGDRIGGLYRGLVKRGRRLKKDTPAPALHAIRIRTKKLRYLIDAFRSLLEPEDVRFALLRLKVLQSVLGRFNDLEVQRDALGRFASEMESRGLGSARLFLAMGREFERRHAESERLRRKVKARFEAFDARDARKAFRSLARGGTSR